MKAWKRMLTATLASLMVFAFAGCGGQDTNTPKGAFEAGMTAYKEYDKNGIQKYFVSELQYNINSFFSAFGIKEDSVEESVFKDLWQSMVGKNEYKVISVEENGNEATLVVEARELDNIQLQANILSEISDAGLNLMSTTISDEEAAKLLLIIKEACQKTPLKDAAEIRVSMILEDGQWKISNLSA